jgi:5-dehydro-2-deoxygluconokinase
MPPAQWEAIDRLIAERDPHCRGVLVLGLNAGIESLAAGFRDAAASAQCRGFAVGRTIFHAPSRAWLAQEIDDATLVRRVRDTFEALIDAWDTARFVKAEA